MLEFFDASPDLHLIVDAQTGRILRANRHGSECFGSQRSAFEGKSFTDAGLRSERLGNWENISNRLFKLADGQQLRLEYLKPDGGRMPVNVTCHATVHGSDDVLHLSLRYASRQQKLEDMLQRKTYSDEVTGLPNRLGFEGELTKSWAQATANEQPLGVMIIEVACAMSIRNEEGGEAYESWIKNCATRLRNGPIRRGDVLARVGWDQFALILQGADNEAVDEVVRRVNAVGDRVESMGQYNSEGVFRIGCAAALPDIHTPAAKLIQMAENQVSRSRNSGAMVCSDLRALDLQADNSDSLH